MFRNSLSSLNRTASKQNGPSVAVIELDKDNKLEFTIDSIIQRKSMEDLLNPKQYEILNKYVDYKGKEFKKEIFNLYKEADEKIDNLIYRSDYGSSHTIPYDIIQPLLDKFDLVDIEDFLINHSGLTVPENFKDVFDEQMETDGILTRPRTYLRSHYIGLVAFITVIKATYMVLAKFSKSSEECLKAPEKDHYLLKFYRKHFGLVNSKPFNKLVEYIRDLINGQSENEDEKQMRIIDKMIEEDEVEMYYVGKVIFQKMTVATIVDDTHVDNIVNSIYSFISNKLKGKGPVRSALRNKTQMVDAQSREKESFVESHLLYTDMPEGFIVLANTATSSIERILQQLPVKMIEIVNKPIIVEDKTYSLHELGTQCARFQYETLTDHTLKMLEVIFKGILDPRYIFRLDLDSIINLLPVGFAYLWNLEFKSLALLLTSTRYEDESEFKMINSTSNKSRIPYDILVELKKLFPLERIGNKNNPDGELVIKKTIEDFGNSFFDITWVSVLDPVFASEVFKTKDGICPVKEDMKIQLAKFLIEHEQYAYPERNLNVQ